MQVIPFAQGTPEWAAARSARFCASEAAAALGLSKHTSRAELLRQKATGIAPDVSPEQRRLFDRGHAAEAAARPLAEAIVGEELAPIVGTLDLDGLPLLASYDGIDMMGEVIWENKLLNQSLVQQIEAGDLEPHYHFQLEHQLLVSGASRALFTTSDGTRDGTHHLWYTSRPERRAQLIAGWKQFAADLAAYEPPAAAAPKATGRTPENLPALLIQVTGHVTASNLVEFREHALAVIAGINRDLQTDADFANAEQTVKWCASAEARLKAAKDAALAQTASIEEAFRVIDDVSAELRRTRLDLDKSVKAEKDNRRAEKVMAARSEFDKHVARLQLDIKGVRLIVPAPDFGGAIKGLSSL